MFGAVGLGLLAFSPHAPCAPPRPHFGIRPAFRMQAEPSKPSQSREPLLPKIGSNPFLETLRRIMEDYKEGAELARLKLAERDLESRAMRKAAAAAGALSPAELLSSVALAAVAVEAGQLALSLAAAWLFGVGVPAGAAAPGARLAAAVAAALAWRATTRPLRLFAQILLVPRLAQEVARIAPENRRTGVRELATQTLAAAAAVLLTVRALDSMLNRRLASAPLLGLSHLAGRLCPIDSLAQPLRSVDADALASAVAWCGNLVGLPGAILSSLPGMRRIVRWFCHIAEGETAVLAGCQATWAAIWPTLRRLKTLVLRDPSAPAENWWQKGGLRLGLEGFTVART